MEDIKDRIHAAMKYQDVTAIELSKRTGIPKSSISQYLSGHVKPKADRIYLIAKALNVNETWLIGYDVPMQRVRVQIRQRDITEISASIGEQLEELEKSHHYSEQFVADSMGIPLDYYQMMKRGENRVFDSDLMLKFSSFYHMRWTDFFHSEFQMPAINDNIGALQVMSGRTDEEICAAIGITQEEYLNIVSGKKKLDYELIEKFNAYYNMTFSSLLGTDLCAHTDNPKKRLSIKMQAYLNDIYDALDGEEFNTEDMEELIDYIKYMAKTKKVKRMRGK